ncbi:MAG: magnesium transporter [Clostridiales bacterium]|nr:magnesium transporter [Clostridiales bacterium]
MIAKVLVLLHEKKYALVRETVQQMKPVDIAEVFDELHELEARETALRLFRLLPKESAAEAFSYMESDVQQDLIGSISDNELRFILDELYMDDYVDLVEEMPANVVKRLLANSSEGSRALINQYLQYPDDSAGSIMTNEYVYFRPHITVREAFDIIRKTGVDKETIYTCYVASPARMLEGVVTVKELLLADPDAKIEDIMSRNVIHVHTLDDKEEIAKLFSRYDMLSLPVVDKEERLVGIITIDDAVDVMQEETTEDFEMMAGMAPSEDAYLRMPVFSLAKNRILWLLILMFSAMLTGALIEHYEAAIATLPLLVSFIPMLMGTGGNCGSQASTMIIRGMALDEIELSDFFRVWWKEVRVALLCGSVLSAANFLRIWLQYGVLSANPEPDTVMIAAVVSLTLIATVCIAKSLGCMLPMLAKRLKLDPAIMAAPMITTLTDALSILVFFSLAVTMLGSRL